MKFRTALSRSAEAPEAHNAQVPAAAATPARRGPSALTKAWANHFSTPQYSVEAVSELVVGDPLGKRLVKQ